jgi:soluble lytic murein transglycosylase-like protein
MDSSNTLVALAAITHDLPHELINAIIQVESGGNTWAYNPEPHYMYLWDVRKNAPFRRPQSAELSNKTPPADFPTIAGDRDQEWWAQQASWGLMQVMGAVAREHGLRAPYLPILCDPAVGIEYGCKHLAVLRSRFFGRAGWPGVIAAYNAGSPVVQNGVFVNQGYVDKVLALAPQFKPS